MLKQADVVHATFSAGEPYRNRKFALVSSVFDMTPEIFAKAWITNPHLNKERWLRNSDHIVSISQTTANDLRDRYPRFQTPVTVIHLGTCIGDVIPRGPSLSLERFWLFVGKRSNYKNFCLLLEAIAPLDKRRCPVLVCVGGGPFNTTERKQLARLGLKERVQLLGPNYIEEPLLRWLYAQSEAVLVPSECEGFSLPLIEALACNAAVVASDIPVHREVGSAFCHFVGSNDTGAWTEQLQAMITTSLSTPADLLGTTRESLMQHYSVSRVAKDHATLYHQLSH